MSAWYEDPWILGGLGVLGVALIIPETRGLVTFAADSGIFFVKDLVGRGNKLTNTSISEGFVNVNPETLRQTASAVYGSDIPNDTYALARMIRSEGAAQGELRGHVLLNDLATFPYASDVFGLATYSTDSSRNGYYGQQYTAPSAAYPNANKRRYSTASDPYESDVVLANQVLIDHANGIDPSQGAVKFLDKSSMGVQSGSGSFDSVNAAWTGDGLVAFTVPEYGDDLVLYKKA